MYGIYIFFLFNDLVEQIYDIYEYKAVVELSDTTSPQKNNEFDLADYQNERNTYSFYFVK